MLRRLNNLDSPHHPTHIPREAARDVLDAGGAGQGMQQALAAAFERAERETFFERQLSAFERRRDILHGALHEAGLPAELPQASYFMLADTSQVRLPAEYVSLPPFRRDYDFARWLTAEIGVACIPPSAFASSDSAERFGNFARFCFCKMDEDIEEAGRRLKRLTEFLQ